MILEGGGFAFTVATAQLASFTCVPDARSSAHSACPRATLARTTERARFKSPETHFSCSFELYSALKQYFIKQGMMTRRNGGILPSASWVEIQLWMKQSAKLPAKRADVSSCEGIVQFNQQTSVCFDWHWHVMASVSWRHALFFLVVGKLNWFVLFMSAFQPIMCVSEITYWL